VTSTDRLHRISREANVEEYMAVNTNMRVLVVDDFSTMRRIIKNILRQLGFSNIIEADDGTAAWEILNKDQVDFIISDWNMPQMTGIELLRKVRASEEFGDLPFLMVTAEAQQENIIEAVQAKISNYIVKPFTAETLGQKINKIFE
jgi:two-component system chemotaxis response regulator CheY